MRKGQYLLYGMLLVSSALLTIFIGGCPTEQDRVAYQKLLDESAPAPAHSLLLCLRNVAYADGEAEVQADGAYVTCDAGERGPSPTHVKLVDHVRLDCSNRGQYALADQATCHLEAHTLLLEGRENRVLFVDTGRNMQLSAPAVRVEYAPEIGREVVQGMGDVRLTLNQEELKRLRG